MPHEHTAPGCADEVSPPVLRCGAESREKDLVVGAGSLNGLLVGFIAFADCEFVTNDRQTFIRHSLRSPRHLSVGDTWRGNGSAGNRLLLAAADLATPGASAPKADLPTLVECQTLQFAGEKSHQKFECCS
jgi:hypothetical protein